MHHAQQLSFTFPKQTRDTPLPPVIASRSSSRRCGSPADPPRVSSSCGRAHPAGRRTRKIISPSRHVPSSSARIPLWPA
ncbi:hypothetical protein SEVIR_1G080401v4 [Setaria viridis]